MSSLYLTLASLLPNFLISAPGKQTFFLFLLLLPQTTVQELYLTPQQQGSYYLAGVLHLLCLNLLHICPLKIKILVDTKQFFHNALWGSLVASCDQHLPQPLENLRQKWGAKGLLLFPQLSDLCLKGLKLLP